MSLFREWRHKLERDLRGEPEVVAAANPITCPFCLSLTTPNDSPSKCSTCEKALPPLYVDAAAQYRPFPIQVFGLPEHGKSVYLAALTMMLRKAIIVWDECICQPATPASQEMVMKVNGYFRTGEMPAITPPGSDECYLMLVPRMARWGSRAVMIRDCSGEAFTGMDVKLDQAKYLLRSPLTFMFLSLADYLSSNGPAMDMLLTNYLNTLISCGVRFDRESRKIVLVLTKADLIADLPQPLVDYIQGEPIRPILLGEPGADQRGFDEPAVDEYMRVLRKASAALKEWFALTADGKTLLALAKVYNIDLCCSLVWSTGFDPGRDNETRFSWRPCRVLDPLFLGLDLSR